MTIPRHIARRWSQRARTGHRCGSYGCAGAARFEPLESRVLLSAAALDDGPVQAGATAASESAVSQPLQANIEASRVSGVAPLAVFFDATGSAGLLNDDHVNAYFQWNFDANAIDAARPHTATGFVAAHVYDVPGTYLVTLIARDESGSTGLAQTTITVHDQPVDGWTTYCVANTATSCPGGQGVLNTIADVNEVLGPDTRVLFKRGDSWDNVEWTFSAVNGPLEIGAYIDPADPSSSAPVLRGGLDPTASVLNPRDVHDIRIQDLHVIGSGVGSGVVAGANSTNILIRRVEVEGLDGNAFGTGNPPFEAAGLFVFDSYVHDFARYALFATANRLAMVNNTVERLDAFQIGHGVRIAGGDKAYIHGNTITHNNGFSAIAIRGKGPGTTTTNVVISDNVVDNMIKISPQNDNFEEHLSNVLVERNLLRPPLGFGTIADGIAISAANVVVRNNLFYNVRRAVNPFTHPLSGVPAGLTVQNNTQYVDQDLNASTSFVGGLATNAVIRNNLVVSLAAVPWSRFVSESYSNVTNNIAYFQEAPGLCVDPAGNQGAGACTDPQLLSTDVSTSDFLAPSVGSVAIDAGVGLPTYVDYMGRPAPYGVAPDIGAVEYAALALMRAPIVSAIGHNVADLDATRSGLQVYAGTPIQFSAIAVDPNGDPLTWNWTIFATDALVVTFATGSRSPTGVRDAAFVFPFGAPTSVSVILVASDGTSAASAQIRVESIESPPSTAQPAAAAPTAAADGTEAGGELFEAAPAPTDAAAVVGTASIVPSYEKVVHATAADTHDKAPATGQDSGQTVGVPGPLKKQQKESRRRLRAPMRASWLAARRAAAPTHDHQRLPWTPHRGRRQLDILAGLVRERRLRPGLSWRVADDPLAQSADQERHVDLIF